MAADQAPPSICTSDSRKFRLGARQATCPYVTEVAKIARMFGEAHYLVFGHKDNHRDAVTLSDRSVRV
jgi:4-hydroxy-3-methylbut-2-enyl diphosphate reductase IspH